MLCYNNSVKGRKTDAKDKVTVPMLLGYLTETRKILKNLLTNTYPYAIIPVESEVRTMALIVMTEATVQYACRLSAEDERKVREYAEQNDVTLEEAVEELYNDCDINLYANSGESDFSTDLILSVDEE